MTAPQQRGIVSEMLAGNRFRVTFEDGKVRICYLSGKMKVNRVRVLLGDAVDVILDPYGGNATNRIIYRHRANDPVAQADESICSH